MGTIIISLILYCFCCWSKQCLERDNKSIFFFTGWRPNMEDGYIIITFPADSVLAGYTFFSIFDGHNGAWVSKFLSENTHIRLENRCKELLSSLPELPEGQTTTQLKITPTQIATIIPNVFLDLDREITETTFLRNKEVMMSEDPGVRRELNRGGSTGVATLISIEGDVISAHVGDSRSLLGLTKIEETVYYYEEDIILEWGQGRRCGGGDQTPDFGEEESMLLHDRMTRMSRQGKNPGTLVPERVVYPHHHDSRKLVCSKMRQRRGDESREFDESADCSAEYYTDTSSTVTPGAAEVVSEVTTPGSSRLPSRINTDLTAETLVLSGLGSRQGSKETDSGGAAPEGGKISRRSRGSSHDEYSARREYKSSRDLSHASFGGSSTTASEAASTKLQSGTPFSTPQFSAPGQTANSMALGELIIPKDLRIRDEDDKDRVTVSDNFRRINIGEKGTGNFANKVCIVDRVEQEIKSTVVLAMTADHNTDLDEEVYLPLIYVINIKRCDFPTQYFFW